MGLWNKVRLDTVWYQLSVCNKNRTLVQFSFWGLCINTISRFDLMLIFSFLLYQIFTIAHTFLSDWQDNVYLCYRKILFFFFRRVPQFSTKFKKYFKFSYKIKTRCTIFLDLIILDSKWCNEYNGNIFCSQFKFSY